MTYIPALPRHRPPVPGYNYDRWWEKEPIDVSKSLANRRFIRDYQIARIQRLEKHLPGLHNQKSHGNQYAKTPWLFDAIVPNMGPAFPDPLKWTAHVSSYSRDPKYREAFNTWYKGKAGKDYIPWSPLDEKLPPPIPTTGTPAPPKAKTVPAELKPDLIGDREFKAALAQGPTKGTVEIWGDAGHYTLEGTFTYNFDNDDVTVTDVALTKVGESTSFSGGVAATITFDSKGHPKSITTYDPTDAFGTQGPAFTKPVLTNWQEKPEPTAPTITGQGSISGGVPTTDELIAALPPSTPVNVESTEAEGLADWEKELLDIPFGPAHEVHDTLKMKAAYPPTNEYQTPPEKKPDPVVLTAHGGNFKVTYQAHVHAQVKMTKHPETGYDVATLTSMLAPEHMGSDMGTLVIEFNGTSDGWSKTTWIPDGDNPQATIHTPNEWAFEPPATAADELSTPPHPESPYNVMLDAAQGGPVPFGLLAAKGHQYHSFFTAQSSFTHPEGGHTFKIHDVDYKIPDTGEYINGDALVVVDLESGAITAMKWVSKQPGHPDIADSITLKGSDFYAQFVDKQAGPEPMTAGPEGVMVPESQAKPHLKETQILGTTVVVGDYIIVTTPNGTSKGELTDTGMYANGTWYVTIATTDGGYHTLDVPAITHMGFAGKPLQPEPVTAHFNSPLQDVWGAADAVDPSIPATAKAATAKKDWLTMVLQNHEGDHVKVQAIALAADDEGVTVKAGGFNWNIPYTQIGDATASTESVAGVPFLTEFVDDTGSMVLPTATAGGPRPGGHVSHSVGEAFYLDHDWSSVQHLKPGEIYNVASEQGKTFTGTYLGPAPTFNGAKPKHLFDVLDPGTMYANSESPYGTHAIVGQADHPFAVTRIPKEGIGSQSYPKPVVGKHTLWHVKKVTDKRRILSAYAGREVKLNTSEGMLEGMIVNTRGKSPMVVRYQPKGGQYQSEVHVKNVNGIEVLSEHHYQDSETYKAGTPTDPDKYGVGDNVYQGYQKVPDEWKPYVAKLEDVITGSTTTAALPEPPKEAVYVPHPVGDTFEVPTGWEAVKHLQPGHLYGVSLNGEPTVQAYYIGPIAAGEGAEPVLVWKPYDVPVPVTLQHLKMSTSTQLVVTDKLGHPSNDLDTPPKKLKLLKFHQNLPEKIDLVTPYVGYKVQIETWSGDTLMYYLHGISKGTPTTVDMMDESGSKHVLKIKDIKTIAPTGPEYYQSTAFYQQGYATKPSQVHQFSGWANVPEDFKPYVGPPQEVAEQQGITAAQAAAGTPIPIVNDPGYTPGTQSMATMKAEVEDAYMLNKPITLTTIDGQLVTAKIDDAPTSDGFHLVAPTTIDDSYYVPWEKLKSAHPAPKTPAKAAPLKPKQPETFEVSTSMPTGLEVGAPMQAVSPTSGLSNPITAPPGFTEPDVLLQPTAPPKKPETFDVDEPAPLEPVAGYNDELPEQVNWTDQDWNEYLGDAAVEGWMMNFIYTDEEDAAVGMTGKVSEVNGDEVTWQTDEGPVTVPLIAMSTAEPNDMPTPPPAPTSTPATAPKSPTTPIDHDPYADKTVPIVLPSGAVDTFDKSWSAQPYKAKQSGSNPGGFYTDGKGRKWYVKVGMHKESYGSQDPYKYDDRSKNEAISARLYAKAGLAVPKVELLDVRTRKDELPSGGSSAAHLGVKSEILGQNSEQVLSLSATINDPGFKKKVQRGFAVDAWVANWDVAGTGWDNILAVDGEPVRVDVGGSMLYRAMGGLKGEDFTYDVREIDTMRGKGQTSDTTKLFSDMTDEQVRESFADTVAKITDADIDAIVDSFALSEIQAPEVKDKLKKRRFDMAEKLGVNLDDHPEINFKFAYDNKKIAHLGFSSMDDYHAAITYWGSSDNVEKVNAGQSGDSTGFANIAAAQAFALRSDIKDPDEFNRVARSAHSVRSANGYNSSEMQSMNSARGWSWSDFADVVEESKNGPHADKWKPIDWVEPDKWEGVWAEHPPQSYDPWVYHDWKVLYEAGDQFTTKWDGWMADATQSHEAGITSHVSGLPDPAAFPEISAGPKKPTRTNVENNNFFKAHLARTKVGFTASVPHTTAADMAKAASQAWKHPFDAATLKSWADGWGGSANNQNVLGMQWAALERYGFKLDTIEKKATPKGAQGVYFRIYNPNTHQWITMSFSQSQWDYLATYKSNATLKGKYGAALAGWNYGAAKQWAKAGVEKVAVVRGTRLSVDWCEQNGVPIHTSADQSLPDIGWTTVGENVSQRGVASFGINTGIAAGGGIHGSGGGNIIVVWRGVFESTEVLGALGSGYPNMSGGGGEGEIMMPAGIGYEVAAFDHSVPKETIRKWIGEGVKWEG